MQYGFLIDHEKCIGCHACTVACKAENEVPVGSFRTWVKYTEKGRFPAIKRHFTVLRCNHCTKAPCVTICPVNALEKRPDGIVDLDRDACIGCRACMQGCPYDAIYLNEDTGSAEKCHYCAHRVEKGLQPACVIVCPEEAIVSGDLHDPESKIARLVKERATLVRRPEQGTGPNVHYVGVEPLTLEPGAAERPDTYLWSERPPTKPEPWPASIPTVPDVRTVLDAGHKVEWGRAVALYLVTKGIAAGAALLAPFLALSGPMTRGLPGDFGARWWPEIAALAFLAITTFLLVEDLHRPLKFLTLLTRPNKKSWLVKGAWILMAFGATVSATLALRWLGFERTANAMRWPSAVLALGVAGYTAFLFAQCEGRDLWQSKVLLPHLIVQAAMCGAAVLMPFVHDRPWLSYVLFAALALHFALLAYERYLAQHATANARQGAAFLYTLRAGGFPSWWLSIGLCAFGGVMASFVPGAVWIPVFVGLYIYECAFVRAGQLPPLS